METSLGTPDGLERREAPPPRSAPEGRDPSPRGRKGLSERQLTLLLVGGGLLALLVAALLSSTLSATLYRPTFVTGWIAWTLVAVLAALWWRPVRELDALERRLRRQGLLQGLLLTAVLLHVDLAWPTGWVETLLFLTFVAATLSWAFGLGLASARDGGRWSDHGESVYIRARREARKKRCAQWLRLHAALLGALVGLSVLHGAFVHLHGLLAHLFLGKGEPS